MRYYLTEAEKREIRQKYLANVRRINEYLPWGHRVSTSLRALNRKLNDPNEQRKYKKALDINREFKLRNEIYKRITSKYEKIPGKTYVLDRMLTFLLDVRPGAEQYNEALIKTYYQHPEAVAQYFYQKTMNLNPEDTLRIAKCSDMENLLFEFYEKHRIECEYAFCLNDAFKSVDQITEEADKYLRPLNASYELISAGGNIARNMVEAYFTIPTITPEQKDILLDEGFRLREPAINTLISEKAAFNAIRNDALNDVKIMSDKLGKGNYDINKPGGMSYYFAQNKETKKYVSIVDFLTGKTEEDCDIVKIDDETAKNIRKIYKKDYIAEENVKFPRPLPKDKGIEFVSDFRYRYAINNNKSLAKLEEKSIGEMLKSVRRGLIETIFKSTSEYTERLMDTLNEFENSRSPDFHNIEKLKEAAEAYLNHRGVKTRADALRQNSASKNRSLLCLDIIAAAKAMNDNATIKENNDIEKDDSIILINEEGKNKDKDLFVDPEEILREPFDNNKIMKEVNDNNIIIENDKKLDNDIKI